MELRCIRLSSMFEVKLAARNKGTIARIVAGNKAIMTMADDTNPRIARALLTKKSFTEALHYSPERVNGVTEWKVEFNEHLVQIVPAQLTCIQYG